MKRHLPWLTWAAVGAALEVYALRTDGIPPLTEETQIVTGVGTPWSALGRGAQLGLSAWFFFHCARKIERAAKNALNVEV